MLNVLITTLLQSQMLATVMLSSHLFMQKQNLLSDTSCNAGEIENLIKLLNLNKATGPDAINNRMLIAVAKEISIPLSFVLIGLSEKESLHFHEKSNVLPLSNKGTAIPRHSNYLFMY